MRRRAECGRATMLPMPPTLEDVEAYRGVLNDVGGRLGLVKDLFGGRLTSLTRNGLRWSFESCWN